MNRAVTYARLQTNAYIVGAGELGTVFPVPNKTLDGLTMNTSKEGLSIKFAYRGIRKELLIPYGNVILMELAPDTKE
jgi:hypothetical protein